MRIMRGSALVLQCLLLAACGTLHPRYTDQEAVDAILAADGSGSGLDADLLDGKDSTEFVLRSDDIWVDEAGDTMTGPLVVEDGVTAEGFFYDSPKRRHLGIAGAAFVPNWTELKAWVSSEDGYGFLRADPWVPAGGLMMCNDHCFSRVTPLSGSIELRAHLDLPKQATVTQFSCFWYDRSGPPEVKYTFKLMRRKWYELTPTVMATVSGSTNDFAPANAVRLATTSTIRDPTVDPLAGVYYVSGLWDGSGGLGDAVRFYGCLVAYDVTRIGP